MAVENLFDDKEYLRSLCQEEGIIYVFNYDNEHYIGAFSIEGRVFVQKFTEDKKDIALRAGEVTLKRVLAEEI